MVELIFYHNFLFLQYISQLPYTTLVGKTNGLDHSWPDNIEHPETRLSICCLVQAAKAEGNSTKHRPS